MSWHKEAFVQTEISFDPIAIYVLCFLLSTTPFFCYLVFFVILFSFGKNKNDGSFYC